MNASASGRSQAWRASASSGATGALARGAAGHGMTGIAARRTTVRYPAGLLRAFSITFDIVLFPFCRSARLKAPSSDLGSAKRTDLEDSCFCARSGGELGERHPVHAPHPARQVRLVGEARAQRDPC